MTRRHTILLRSPRYFRVNLGVLSDTFRRKWTVHAHWRFFFETNDDDRRLSRTDRGLARSASVEGTATLMQSLPRCSSVCQDVLPTVPGAVSFRKGRNHKILFDVTGKHTLRAADCRPIYRVRQPVALHVCAAAHSYAGLHYVVSSLNPNP